MRVLGISAFYHDSAAALIEDGRIVAAEFMNEPDLPAIGGAPAPWL